VTADAEPFGLSVQPVILCGGSGTRLWPLSRLGFPKQFLCLTGTDSLFQLAAARLAGLARPDVQVSGPIVVTGEEHRFLAVEQLREAGIALRAALLEPVGRNTAPALTLAALAATVDGDDPILVVTPADQTVTETAAFAQAIDRAIRQAAAGGIVILGITPDHPATGYGYIRAERGADTSFTVRHFAEKPAEETARRYLAEGGYFWNAGIFVLRASTWLNALDAFRPDIAAATRVAWDKRSADANPATPFIRPGRLEFAAIPSDSIDYAVMERCPGSAFAIGMVPLDAGWSDLGAWDAVWDVLPKDDNGNAHHGDTLAVNTSNSLIYSSSRLVSLLGVSNLVVIETPDAVLVADKSRTQDVKLLVEGLHADGREEHALHRKVLRPWGWYDSIDQGGRFKVKRIQVNPGASISLQRHHHRAEHWVVVMGTAEVTNGDKTVLLSENQSTYIPLGELHRLSNPGIIPLEIIEVQSGSYLGEDDIVRFEDDYGREQDSE